MANLVEERVSHSFQNMNIAKAKDIDGWMYENELEWLAEIASTAKVILEIGSFKGRSARAIADNTPGIVYCIDPWEETYYNDDGTVSQYVKPNVMNEFENNLRDHIDSRKVFPIRSTFSSYKTPIKYDFIFIDGDHRYDSVVQDIKLAKSILEKNGILAGHDYNMPGWPSVQKAVDSIFPEVNLVNTIWWIRL